MKKLLTFLVIISLFFVIGMFSCKKQGIKDVISSNDSKSYMSKKKSKMDSSGVELSYSVNDEMTNSQEFNTEEYDKVQENNFKDVITNPVSTFSIDVDTASYSNVRRFLNNNSMPPIDAVRIEELVNYFDYDYPLPKDENPFSVNLEMSKCPWNKDRNLLMIGLKGKELQQTEIPPSNLVFLLDVSGSMEDPNKLPLLKAGYKILVSKLRPVDRVAIVVYAGAAGLILDSTSGEKKNDINKAIENLRAGGSTAGGEGLQLAYQVAKKGFIPGGNNRIILATDGDFNIGPSSDAEMVRLIEEKRKEGIFITILGFGMGNYKDSKMEKIADAGNGNYYYIDNILEAKKVLSNDIWGTLFTIAKDVKIQIEFNPANVKGYRLIGYENRILNKEDFNDDKKDAGEIGAGHRVTAFYEIIPASSNEEIPGSDKLEYQKTTVVESADLMTLKLRYKNPDEDKSNLMSYKVIEKDIFKDNISQNFNFGASVVEFGLLLRNSEHKGNASYDNVLERAKKSKGKDDFGYREEFIKLVEIAKLLKK